MFQTLKKLIIAIILCFGFSYSQSLSFDGTNDYVDIGNVFNDVKTISFWIHADDITSHTDQIIDLNGTDYIKIVNGEIRKGDQVIVLAGKEFGAGSSRDWAAKGSDLLGIRATIAESYERIFRDNLVGMGVLPLQFEEGESRMELGLDGSEKYDIVGLESGVDVGQKLRVIAEKEDGNKVEFSVVAQVNTPAAVKYIEHGGILNYVLRRLLA